MKNIIFKVALASMTILSATAISYAERDDWPKKTCAVDTSVYNYRIITHSQLTYETGSRDPMINYAGYRAFIEIPITKTKLEKKCVKQVWQETELKCGKNDNNFADFAVDCKFTEGHYVDVIEDCGEEVSKVYATLSAGGTTGYYGVTGMYKNWGGKYKNESFGGGRGGTSVPVMQPEDQLPIGFAGLPSSFCLPMYQPPSPDRGPSH